MNKVVAILGIIVLITLGGLFFCAGFFTGTTMTPAPAAKMVDAPTETDKKITMKDVDAVIDTKSETISEKIMGILSSAADTASSSVNDMIERQQQNKQKNQPVEDESLISVDSLLREITASHSTNDDCSTHKTLTQINAPKQTNLQGMQGKKIVFIGYFKNKIALQLQQLLVSKGYKTHVEVSKTGDRDESFVFCGPFKKEKNAQKLVKWLRKHEFYEARLISVSKEAIEETLYDFINDDSNLPANAEKDIPEMQNIAIPQNTVTQPQASAVATPTHMQTLQHEAIPTATAHTQTPPINVPAVPM